MKRFKNILLVCDFHLQQQMAVDRAASLARQNGASLTVLSVVREGPVDMHTAKSMPVRVLLEQMVADHREKLDALVAPMRRQGIDARPQVVTGIPFLEIIRKVLRDKHDLVILAAEGKGGLKERLFGSTSMHLMRKCPCPVWVVKPAKRFRHQKILAAVDTTDEFPDHERQPLNVLIMELASSLARMDNGELHVIQAWSVFAEGYMEVRGGLSEQSIHQLRKQVKREYAAQLDALLMAVDLEGIAVRKHLPRSDNPSRAIIKLVKNNDIDLLVMGTVCRTGIAGFFIGNTAEKVLSEADCSVLTVKPESFVTPVRLEES
ncbi:universal stress protein [Thiolapillus sp.]